jgi:hypothetical protein
MTAMKRFPAAVRSAMSGAGAMATCMPVQLDGAAWEAAFFVRLDGAQSKDDRRAMARGRDPFAMGMETDVVETEHGAVVVLRPELHTRPGDPLVFEILLTPGVGGNHHEALSLLATQGALSWFFSDASGWLLHAQTLVLQDEHRQAFAELQRQSLRHDTLIRLTGSYDAANALGQVVRHYELRPPGEQSSSGAKA